MEGCMLCGKDSFKKYLFDIHKPIKNVYVDEEVRDLLGEQYIDFSTDSKICLPCVCLVHTLCNFKHIMKASLISYPKDGAIIKEFKNLNANLAMIPYSACTDAEIDDYKSKNPDRRRPVHGKTKKVNIVAEEKPEEDDARREDEDEENGDEMLSVMYSEKISRASVYSPTSQEVMKSFKVTKKRKMPSSSIVTRAKSAPCEQTEKLPYELAGKKSSTPFLDTNISDKPIIYRCLLNICYHHYESFDQLLHHVISEHGLQQNDLNFEEYKQKLEEYLEKKNSKLKFDVCTSLQMEITKDIESKYPCLTSSCFKKYKSISDLNHHKVNDHKIWPRYSCSECYKVKFTSREDLLWHNYLNHFVINSYCVYCSEPLKNLNDLYYHLETHEIYKHPCKYCDKFFFSMNSARLHSRIHREDKYKKKIERPRQKTIILRRYMAEGTTQNVGATPSRKNEDFSRILLQPTYQKRDDEIVNVSTPDDQYIINRRDSCSSVDKFDDFTVPDAPSDREGSTISDYINRVWSDMNSEHELNTSFDLDRCEDGSSFSDYIKKKRGLGEEDVTDDVSTISEFIKKRRVSEPRDDSNKKVTVISEFVMNESGVASEGTSGIVDEEPTLKDGKSAMGVKGVAAYSEETAASGITCNDEPTLNVVGVPVEESAATGKKGDVAYSESVMEETVSGDEEQEDDGTNFVVTNENSALKVITCIESVLKTGLEVTSIKSVESDDATEAEKFTVSERELPLQTNTSPDETFEFHEDIPDEPTSPNGDKDEPAITSKTSIFDEREPTLTASEFGASKSANTSDFEEVETIPYEFHEGKEVVITETDFSPKPTSSVGSPDTPQTSDDKSSTKVDEELKSDSDVSDDDDDDDDDDDNNGSLTSTLNSDSDDAELVDLPELKRKFKLREFMIIVEDCSSVIEPLLDPAIRKRAKKPGRRVRRKPAEDPPEPPAKIDAGCFEKFAAERLGQELVNPFAIPTENITYQADFEIPCAETVEITSVETDFTELEAKQEEKPVIKKRVRKREIQLLQQITPLEIRNAAAGLSDSKVSRRGRTRRPPKKYDPLPMEKPSASSSTTTVSIVPETVLPIAEMESADGSVVYGKGVKPAEELEVPKTKFRRLGMTDIIKRTIPGKSKVRNNAL